MLKDVINKEKTIYIFEVLAHVFLPLKAQDGLIKSIAMVFEDFLRIRKIFYYQT
jgi:hypothetical protein